MEFREEKKKERERRQFESSACIISRQDYENGVFTLGYYNGNWTVRAIQICLSFCGMRAVRFWFVQSARREVTFSLFSLSSSSSLFYKSCTSLFLVFSGCLNSIHLYDLGKRNACRLPVIIIYATWYELAYAYVWNSDFSQGKRRCEYLLKWRGCFFFLSFFLGVCYIILY